VPRQHLRGFMNACDKCSTMAGLAWPVTLTTEFWVAPHSHHRFAPHVGLPDMSVSFQVRKRAAKTRLPSPACPAGSKVSFLATQCPHVALSHKARPVEQNFPSGWASQPWRRRLGSNGPNCKTRAPAGQASRGPFGTIAPERTDEVIRQC